VALVRKDLTVGLAGQVTVLVMIAATVDLSVAGWLTGVSCGVVMSALLHRAMHRVGAGTFGPADWVTLTRATLVGGVTALVADAVHHPAAVPAMVTLASVALVLDAVDGQVARRTGTESGLGARFDMEVDAFLILVLSLYVARSMGWWVVAIGAMRYLYVVASWALPWLRLRLPARYWRKVVAAIQGIMLVVAMAGVLPAAAASAGVAVSLALLVESFGRDVAWQWRHRPAGAVTVFAAVASTMDRR
jgi:phosphatidylglycerophosphate synthase